MSKIALKIRNNSGRWAIVVLKISLIVAFTYVATRHAIV